MSYSFQMYVDERKNSTIRYLSNESHGYNKSIIYMHIINLLDNGTLQNTNQFRYLAFIKIT